MTGEATAAEILRLDPSQAARLFPGDAAAVARRYRRLAWEWHPDRNPAPQAAAVFARIAELHAVAVRALAGPTREERFRTRDGRSFRFAWRTRREGDAGEVLVGRRHIAHRVRPEADDLARRAAALVLPFAGETMRAEMAPFLPRPITVLETAAGAVFVEAKAADEVLLGDLLKLGPVEPRHAAWMTTRLLNLGCWLQWAGLAHGAIGPDCLLVSPTRHTVALTGPFLTAARFGEAPRALPERTLAELPWLHGHEAVVDGAVDPALIRLTVREALGDPAGMRLLADPAFPAPFAAWLTLPAADGAQADFRAWEQARDAAFGPRRFIPWDFDPDAALAA